MPAAPLIRFLPVLLLTHLLSAATFQPTTYGARADGVTPDTLAIQSALDKAAESPNGTVTFTPGRYLTGALFVKSGVTLQIDKGVELIGSQDLAAYPILQTRVAGIEMKWPAALINVYQQHDVAITGDGLVDGNGKIWWDKYWRMRREIYEPKGLRWAADYDCQRPRLLQIYNSSNVKLERLNLHRSGFWTVHICYSHHVTVDGVTIRNNIGGKGPSTDGIDIDSSSEVTVQHCDIQCNDDAICLKAGRDADGLRVNRPTEHITITDNTVGAGAAGVTFGSETSGGIRDVQVSGLKVAAPVADGILFKSASTRGGTIQDIGIHNVTLDGVANAFAITFNWNPSYSYATMPKDTTGTPDYYKVLTEPVSLERGLPHLRNVTVSDLHAVNAKQAFSVASYKDSPLENVSFTNLDIHAQTAGALHNTAHWVFTNSNITTADHSTLGLPAADTYFSIKVPGEGNYLVTLKLGARNYPSSTTVKAELRRLMLLNIKTQPGEFVTRSFLVNTRTPAIPNAGEVRLKPREKTSEAWAWDDQVTLEITGDRPALESISVEKAPPSIPTLYIAGDSTSTDQGTEPFNSWGQMLPYFFKPDISVANHGESGESLHSFIAENRLRKIMSLIKPGDYLFIQMGHNDQKEKGDGVGAFTAYKLALKHCVEEARSHGAFPVLITSMNRLTFDTTGVITNSLGDFPEAVRQLAHEEQLPLIDLNAMSKPLYEALGPKDAHLLFAGADTTHHSDYGSYELAQCIVKGVRANHLPIEKYLIDNAPDFDPAHPDPIASLNFYPESVITAQKPYGN